MHRAYSQSEWRAVDVKWVIRCRCVCVCDDVRCASASMASCRLCSMLLLLLPLSSRTCWRSVMHWVMTSWRPMARRASASRSAVLLVDCRLIHWCSITRHYHIHTDGTELWYVMYVSILWITSSSSSFPFINPSPPAILPFSNTCSARLHRAVFEVKMGWTNPPINQSIVVYHRHDEMQAM